MREQRQDCDYDFIIVGSGFGGSITALKLVEAGAKVCLLERGKHYAPGEFARSPAQMKKNFWDPTCGLYGLYHFHISKKLATLTSAGVGGGSLIYSNVLLRKAPETFDTAWPFTAAELAPHYERIERRLGARVFPAEHAPYKDLPKMIAMRDSAARHRTDWSPTPLGVEFGEGPGQSVREAPNLHGRARVACQLCGECNLGCNYGSKNSLDHTYLSAAGALGLEIRPLAEARDLVPKAYGYEVGYLDHSGSEPVSRSVTARQLVLSAGAINSPYLLLKNRKYFPKLSIRLGDRFGGNGDLLTFAFLAKKDLNPTQGPIITSTIRKDEFYIQDTAFPAFLAWAAESTSISGWFKRISGFSVRRSLGLLASGARTNFGSEISQLAGNCKFSSRSMPICCSGNDLNLGKLHLSRGGKLELDWDAHQSKDYYTRLRKEVRRITNDWGATTIDTLHILPKTMSTVHPHGGCVMGQDATRGVVDSYGGVFGYPGLHICDGSILPGPVGANPALTIAAVADRCAGRMADRFMKDKITPKHLEEASQC